MEEIAVKILIIDDDKKFTDTLKDDVIKFFQRIDDKAIITVINENFRQVDLFNNYHIVFLDIDLLTDNGLTIAKQLRELDSNAMIIFVSSRSNLVFKTFVVSQFACCLQNPFPCLLRYRKGSVIFQNSGYRCCRYPGPPGDLSYCSHIPTS